MNKKTIVLIITLIFFLILTASYFMPGLFLTGKNIQSEIHLPDCSRISVPAPEDIEYIPGLNVIIVSSMDRRHIPENTGSLYFININDSTIMKAEKMMIEYPPDFRPHGISHRATDDGILLYVVSHPLKGEFRHTIEVFTMKKDGGTLTVKHNETLGSSLLISPNNCAAAPDGTLFVSHDNFIDSGKTGGDFNTKLDYLLRRERCPITVYSKGEFYDSEYKVTSGNGIAYTSYGKREFIFHADSFRRIINILELKRTSDKVLLKVKWTLPVEGMPDNLTFDKTGNCYAAAHFSLGLVMDHEKNPEVLSPTMIYKITPDYVYGNHKISTVYANRGEEIPCGSTAYMAGNRLYIGQIFNDFILSCLYNQN